MSSPQIFFQSHLIKYQHVTSESKKFFTKNRKKREFFIPSTLFRYLVSREQ